MHLHKFILFLIALVFIYTSGFKNSRKQMDTTCVTDSNKAFPCWNQSWRCGKWEPLTYKLDARDILDGRTPSGKLLMISTCGWCNSIRVVDPENIKERILLSLKGRIKHCKHRWRPAIHSFSFDPIESGDALFIIYDKQMYALIIETIFTGFLDTQKISYKIAKVTNSASFPTRIHWKKLSWQSQMGKHHIPVGNRIISFATSSISKEDKDDTKKYLDISYDNYYGSLGRPTEPKELLHIAVVHKSYLENNDIVDLTKFRFKTWEDGLGSRCDISSVYNEQPIDKTVFLDLHGKTVRNLAADPNGGYIVSTGDDGRLVIHYLNESIQKIIGPFHEEEKLLCLALSRDGTTILAGGAFNNYRGILKVNVVSGKYEEVRISSICKMMDIFYCDNDTHIAYFTADNKLSFFNLVADKFISSHRIFGGFIGDIDASPERNYFAVISMNEVNKENSEPCKLTIFDRQGRETLSYQFESCDEGYNSRINFLAPDCLAVCMPTGEMWQWRWASNERKWKVAKKVKIPLGPFSAVMGSLENNIVWLARKESILAINATTGETVYKSSFDIGKPKSKIMGWPIMEPITSIELIPTRQILVLGFWDGRVALMPIPASVSSIVSKQ